jgi:hypothetical protein
VSSWIIYRADIIKATVFPVPDCVYINASLPFVKIGIVKIYGFVGLSYPLAAIDCKTGRDSISKSSKFFIYFYSSLIIYIHFFMF